MVKYIPPWEEQEFIQLVFPHQDTDWAEYLEEAIQTFVNIATIIQKYQKVLIIAQNLSNIKSRFKNKKNLIFVKLNSNDTWSRDFGGISVRDSVNGTITILDFKFNGWGKKYPYKIDNDITKQLKFKGLLKQYYHQSIPFVLEGGSIETNGQGVLLTTKRCLLEKNRNPHLTQSTIAKKLQEYLGIKKVLWLESGYLEGDDTDGHIDTLARFIDANTIVYQSCDDKSDTHYEELKKMENELKNFTNLDNQPFKLLPLPWIKSKYYKDERLPATYANFIFVNGAIIVPTYNDTNDEKCLDIFKKLFPKKDIVGCDCSTLIKQHGSLHCVTMEYFKC
jgi:agmatine deiminase